MHGALMDIEQDLVGDFFAKCGYVEDVMAVKSKMNFATRDIMLQVTMSHKYFLEVFVISMLEDPDHCGGSSNPLLVLCLRCILKKKHLLSLAQ